MTFSQSPIFNRTLDLRSIFLLTWLIPNDIRCDDVNRPMFVPFCFIYQTYWSLNGIFSTCLVCGASLFVAFSKLRPYCETGRQSLFAQIQRPIENRRLSAVSCAKTAEPIHFPFRLWTRVGWRMHKFNRIRQVAPMCPYGRTRCRHLSNNIESSFYSNDVPYVKLLWPLVIFGHAHLDSHTDSQALRAEYCIVGMPHNTAI